MEGEREFDGGKLYIDTEITPELKEEWLVKEFMRAIQDARKKLGLSVEKKINVTIPEDDAFKKFEKLIKESTGCELTFTEPIGDKFEFKFEKTKFYFGVEL